MRAWHYLSEGEQCGPLPENYLVDAIRDGRIPVETMVWTEGMPEWIVASEVHSLVSQIYPGADRNPARQGLRNPTSIMQPATRNTIGILQVEGLHGRRSSAPARPDPSSEERRSILQRREWSYVLDIILILLLNLFVGFALGILSAADIISISIEELQSISNYLGWGISGFFILFKDSSSGRSFGKGMTGLRVVDAETGRSIGPLQSALRNWIFLVPLFPLVELIVASSRKDKKRLGDLMANTIVVRK